MSGPLPFTGVSQAAQLMDHLTNLLWAGGWEEGKGTGGVAGVSPWFSKEFCVACICCVHWRCCFLSGVLYRIL